MFPDNKGNLIVEGEHYCGKRFRNLDINPKMGQTIIIRDTTFENCSVSPGTFVVSKGVVLERVEILNLDCGDAIRIDSDVILKEVVISGSKPSLLMIQPESEDLSTSALPEEVSFSVDVSRFDGEVCIIGIPSSSVKRNPDRHVIVKSSWDSTIDFQGLGIGPYSYWMIYLDKILDFNASDGVFSLPLESDPTYKETIKEKAILEKAGVSF